MTDPALISERLACAALLHPEDEAISYSGLHLTWREWHGRVRRVTGALAAAGVRHGDRVAVIDRNHIACLDIMMAAGALGAATVVVNWRLTDPELIHILIDSSPRVVFIGDALVDRADHLRKGSTSVERVIVLNDDYDAWVAAGASVGPSPEATPDDIVLVIYTSGTTGQPKGAMFNHRGLNANSIAAAGIGAMGPRDRSLVSMPLFHVGGVGAALAAVHEGVPITLLREPATAAIVEAIDQGCTRVFLVPAVISTVLDAGTSGSAALASMSLVTYGGAPCPRPVIAKALAALPDTAFVQVYGMTELCGTVTTLTDRAHRDPHHPERLASVGRVIEGTEMRIVDPLTLEDLPPGGSGELWFRSPKRMVGYLNRPDATAEIIAEGDWVRTGDVGRVDSDGFVFIEDRLKDVIITGGENVYSPEVEAVLTTHPTVAEVAVIGVPDPAMGEAVIAVVTAAAGHTVDEDTLIAFAREHLARFKCPRSVMVVDALPRNAAGKVLKTALRESSRATSI